jgi:transposase
MDTQASPPMPRDWREGRRLRAWDLKQQGRKQRDIAAALGVSGGAVSQWMKRAGAGGGREALRARPAPGPRPRLDARQQQEVLAILGRGAEAYGFRGEVWTAPRVARVIRQEYRVCYDPGHVSRLLRGWGWSVQQPIRRASQRDERAIAT